MKRTRDMAYMALMAVVIAVCAWITVPGPVPFTMQTFGVFCALELLRGRRGSGAVAVYILLGAVGLPVFSGFTGGIGQLLGVTGGYIVGFEVLALVYWALTAVFGTGRRARTGALALGLCVCYAFGTVWFVMLYAGRGGISVGAALAKCVLPFLLPDAAKLALASALVKQLKKRTDL